MNTERTKELEDISNDFLRKLGKNENEIDSLEKPLKTELIDEIKAKSNKKILNLPNFSLSQLYNRKANKKVTLVKINYK